MRKELTKHKRMGAVMMNFSLRRLKRLWPEPTITKSLEFRCFLLCKLSIARYNESDWADLVCQVLPCKSEAAREIKGCRKRLTLIRKEIKKLGELAWWVIMSKREDTKSLRNKHKLMSSKWESVRNALHLYPEPPRFESRADTCYPKLYL